MRVCPVWSSVVESVDSWSAGEVCALQDASMDDGGRPKVVFCQYDWINFVRPGYIYALKAGPVFKLGQSDRGLRRIDEIYDTYHSVQPQLPYLPEYAYVFECWEQDQNLIERYLHKTFSAYRERGEWFALPPHIEEEWFQRTSLPIPWPTVTLCDGLRAPIYGT